MPPRAHDPHHVASAHERTGPWHERVHRPDATKRPPTAAPCPLPQVPSPRMHDAAPAISGARIRPRAPAKAHRTECMVRPIGAKIMHGSRRRAGMFVGAAARRARGAGGRGWRGWRRGPGRRAGRRTAAGAARGRAATARPAGQLLGESVSTRPSRLSVRMARISLAQTAALARRGSRASISSRPIRLLSRLKASSICQRRR